MLRCSRQVKLAADRSDTAGVPTFSGVVMEAMALRAVTVAEQERRAVTCLGPRDNDSSATVWSARPGSSTVG